MSLQTSYIVEQAFEAIEASKFGRFRFCVESLLENLKLPNPAYQEDPRFALFVLLEKSVKLRSDRRFVKLSVDTLRRLAEETEGQLRVVCELRLASHLLCAECHTDNPEFRRKILEELDSLPQSEPLGPDRDHRLALWYWFRYWQARYQTSEFLYFFLASSFMEELKGRFPGIELAVSRDQDLLKSFLLLHEPIHEDEQLFRTFERHALERGLGGIFAE